MTVPSATRTSSPSVPVCVPLPPPRRVATAATLLPAGDGALREVFERFQPEDFERGSVLIENTYLQTGADGSHPSLAYVHEGLVRGVWNRSKFAPLNRATATVAGDGRWIGADAFKFSENHFRYIALTPTRASIVPLRYIRDEAPRAVLLDALNSVSLDWCTTASVLTLGGETLYRRTLLLLFDLRRLHPRPELEVRQQDVADLLGRTRQTLQPVLKRLEAAGLVHLGYSEIVVGDAAELFQELRRAV